MNQNNNCTCEYCKFSLLHYDYQYLCLNKKTNERHVKGDYTCRYAIKKQQFPGGENR
jgi:hypothetical protein